MRGRFGIKACKVSKVVWHEVRVVIPSVKPSMTGYFQKRKREIKRLIPLLHKQVKFLPPSYIICETPVCKDICCFKSTTSTKVWRFITVTQQNASAHLVSGKLGQATFEKEW